MPSLGCSFVSLGITASKHCFSTGTVLFKICQPWCSGCWGLPCCSSAVLILFLAYYSLEIPGTPLQWLLLGDVWLILVLSCAAGAPLYTMTLTCQPPASSSPSTTRRALPCSARWRGEFSWPAGPRWWGLGVLWWESRHFAAARQAGWLQFPKW